jgi:hypothetical protein
MEKYALCLTKVGKEEDSCCILKSAAVSTRRARHCEWYGLQMGPSTFGILILLKLRGRKAHLEGKIAEALMQTQEHYFLKIL